MNEDPNYLTQTNESYELYALFGKDIDVICFINGSPDPKYEWKTEKFKVKTNPYKYSISGNVLKIKYFHYSDAGIYTCTANNGFKELSMDIKVKRAGLKLKKKIYKSYF